MTRHKSQRVYKIRHGDEFELLLPINNADFDYSIFDTTSRVHLWKAVRMHRVRDETHHRAMLPSDFPSGGMGDLVLSGHAKKIIGMVLERYGELLPLDCDDGEYWTFNVRAVLDALDENCSELLRSVEDGSILMINRYVFHTEILANAMIFKLPQFRRGPPLVTTPFVELIKSSGLTGLIFKQIWASD